MGYTYFYLWPVTFCGVQCSREKTVNMKFNQNISDCYFDFRGV